jgi:Xaa-Pro aminopeptidase
MTNRPNAVRRRFPTLTIDALLLTDLTNIRYLTGFTGSNGLLLLTRQAATFLTDFRYQEQVKTEVKGCSIKIATRNLFDDFVALGDLAAIKKLGFESQNLTVQNHTKLKISLPDIKLVACNDIVSEIRAVKEPAEITKIKTAVGITDRVFKRILKLIKPGVKEKDLSLEIDYQLKQAGDGIAFPTIVVSGPRSALPHGQPTDHRIKNRDFITFDMGATAAGYASDFTRTVILGKPNKKQQEVYTIVLEAQLKAIDGIKAGIRAQAADGYARDYIKAHGYGEYFGHGLGHGLGLNVHELPVLSQKSEANLVENNVVTVEPGIYLPGWGGVRIEDVVIVQPKGCTILTQTTKRLLEL